MNKKERIDMIKAMELIARSVNDENIFINYWLEDGIPDGEIDPRDTDESRWDNEYDLGYWLENERLSELMGVFLKLMAQARMSGGLYCDGITDKDWRKSK